MIKQGNTRAINHQILMNTCNKGSGQTRMQNRIYYNHKTTITTIAYKHILGFTHGCSPLIWSTSTSSGYLTLKSLGALCLGPAASSTIPMMTFMRLCWASLSWRMSADLRPRLSGEVRIRWFSASICCVTATSQ